MWDNEVKSTHGMFKVEDEDRENDDPFEDHEAALRRFTPQLTP